MRPTEIDIHIWRGNTAPPIAWAWPEGHSASPDIELSVWTRQRTLILTAQLGTGLAVDNAGRRYLWFPTAAQSRAIPANALVRYELEDRSGVELTLFAGAVTAEGGFNRDTAGDPALDFSDPANVFYAPTL